MDDENDYSNEFLKSFLPSPEEQGKINLQMQLEISMDYKFIWLLVVQIKRLIKHSDWLAYDNMPDETDADLEAKKTYLHQLTGSKEWFTDKSPLYEAIQTGVMNCNGIHPVKVIAL